MSQGKSLLAAELFHYPEDEKGKELTKDKTFVAASIAVLHSCMGQPSRPSPGATGDVFVLGVGGGDLPHWQQHDEPTVLVYSVQFGEISGRIFFDFIQGNDGIWGIRQVKYGLPLGDPRTNPLLAACRGKLSALNVKNRS